MTRKKILLLVSVLVLLLFLAWLALQRTNKKSTLDPAETAFAVEDTAAVDQIFIAYKDNPYTATLKRNRTTGVWILNDTFEVRPVRMKVLLETLKGIKVRRPVTQSESNEVVKSLAVVGIKIEVYQNGQKTKVLYLGPENLTNDSNFAILEGAENPYLIHLPGHNGIIDVRFRVRPNEWRDSRLFKSYYKDIERIQVVYHQDTSNSYLIQKMEGNYVVNGRADIDSTFILNYLSKFSAVYCETIYEVGTYESFMDSLNRQAGGPTGFIEVVDVRPERSNKVVFYMNPENMDTFFATDNLVGDLVRVQHESFKGLLYQRKGFFRKQ
jgi:hypothetical protein